MIHCPACRPPRGAETRRPATRSTASVKRGPSIQGIGVPMRAHNQPAAAPMLMPTSAPPAVNERSFTSLADAETREDHAQEIVRAELSGDSGKCRLRLAQLFR